jgi:3-methylcrotonyl-CoA carboxylase alpha subunit
VKKILIANRGEIACRINRSAHAMGLRTVAVYSEADAEALHVEQADEAVLLGPATPRDSYLNIERIMAAARSAGADAVHPGYGFLSENATFASAVQDAGLTWIGPSPKTVLQLGDKARSRELAISAGVPVLPASRRFRADELDGLHAAADAVGFPLLVKASGGGGGIGMRKTSTPVELATAVSATQQLAGRAFGDSTVYLERFVSNARHIEIQVFGFGNGQAVHLFERECSIQRRFQKVIEESPSTALDESTRSAMTDAALRLVGQLRYAGAGTVEFVFDNDSGGFYFLEVNTRIQVEHPVTEMLTGVDLVKWQISLAAGDGTTVQQDDISRTGHVIECRVYAENPAKNFLPSAGLISSFALPALNGHVRIDTGLRRGDKVTIHYDPMIAKVICGGIDRDTAISKSLETLGSIKIEGLNTNIPFLMKALDHHDFRSGQTMTSFIEKNLSHLL